MKLITSKCLSPSFDNNYCLIFCLDNQNVTVLHTKQLQYDDNNTKKFLIFIISYHTYTLIMSYLRGNDFFFAFIISKVRICAQINYQLSTKLSIQGREVQHLTKYHSTFTQT